MSTSPDSFAIRILKKLSHAVYHRPGWFFYPQLVLFALCVYYTILHLQFDMSRNNLVGSDKKYQRIFDAYKKEFNVKDDIVAVVESENAEKNRQFVERLGAKLEHETNLFTDVFYKGDLKMLGRKALLFLDEKTLGEMQSTMRDYRPFIIQFARATNLDSIFSLINRQIAQSKREQNAENESLVKAIPALRRIVDLAADSIQRSGMPPSPGITALFDAGQQAQEEEYITFAHGRIYLVNCRPAKDDVSEQAVIRVRQLVEETNSEVPGVNAGLTGEPVLEYDEMVQSQKDSMQASIISLVLSALIFIAAYRETGRPIKATLALIIGLGYTLGYTTLTVGHLNILTITFLPILIGLAIDYGVHLITRFEEEMRRGRPVRLALEKAMSYTGLGILTGCLTTAGAFFAMALTNFKGIQEMGIITGGGMLVCFVPMMTFLPVLLKRGKQNVIDEQFQPEDLTRARLEKMWLDRPGIVLGVTAAITALAVIPAWRVYFDYNLLHMQSKGLQAVEFEQKLIDSASKSVLFAAVIADNNEQALQLEHSLTNLPTVASVDSMAKFLGGGQTRKLEIIGEVKEDLAPIKFAQMDREPVDVPELSRTLWSLQGYLGLILDEIPKETESALALQVEELRKSVENMRHEMLTANRREASERLGAYQRALFGDLQETFQALRTQDNSSPLEANDLPGPLRTRFIGNTGRQVLQVYPKSNVWDRADQERFVRDVRSIQPDATGTPIQLYEYTTLLKDSYIQAAWYSLGAIVILVLLHFRSLVSLILSLLPVMVGSVWTLGIMGICNVPFNPANIMTLPLVIGIGVTNGIHILNRFAEEQNPSILAKSTGKAVLVSALTAIAGFGSLIPAKHQGIRSLGIVMSVGIAMCMLAALTFLPSLLTVLMRVGWKVAPKEKPSDDNAQSTLGREEPRINLNRV
jgi:hopanoid biosynthesis associated RND transporter like protein HpnN